jgi:hypothetical protein
MRGEDAEGEENAEEENFTTETQRTRSYRGINVSEFDDVWRSNVGSFAPRSLTVSSPANIAPRIGRTVTSFRQSTR